MSKEELLKKFFSGLIGLDITKAREKLGYWWICTNCTINSHIGFYAFERAAGGKIELQTDNNIVISEHHNGLAEMYQKRDIDKDNGKI